MRKKHPILENTNIKVNLNTWDKLRVKEKMIISKYCKEKNIKLIPKH